MPNNLLQIKKDLRKKSNKEKAKILQRFFKTGPGEYGYGDKFLGVMVPEQRKIVEKYYDKITLSDIQILLQSNIHEERLIALLILVAQFEKGTDKIRSNIYKLYLRNLKYINNWDLVDLSAPKIVGTYLFDKDKKILIKLARNNHLWSRRVAIIATYNFIKKGECDWTIKISKILLRDKHDLIHKAVGWMLREVGKNCGEQIEKKFLDQYALKMPRTMLRYAIEKFSLRERKKYMAKK